MWDFIISTTVWTLALYGLFEIAKTIIYICSYTKLQSRSEERRVGKECRL